MKHTLRLTMALLAVGASLAFLQPIQAQQRYFGTPGTATASAGAATLNQNTGTVTSESLTTAAAANYTLTLTNNKITTGSLVLCNVTEGTNTTVGTKLWTVTPGSGSATIVVKNTHASAALNGTIKVTFFVYP